MLKNKVIIISSDITIIPTDANSQNLKLYYIPIYDLGFNDEGT